MDEYPEHCQLQAHEKENYAISDFLEWLEADDIVLARSDETCLPITERPEQLLARYFDIDLKELETEKRDMLRRQGEQRGDKVKG